MTTSPEPAHRPVTPSSARRPRVGHIQFLNCLPIYWGLVQSNALLDVELTKDNPDRLNDALVRGDLDIAPISLVEFLRHSADLVVLPDIAVGSDGPVLSVNLFSSGTLSELDGEPVALGSTSRTGVTLARLWLGAAHGVQPKYYRCLPELGAMMQEAKAGVLIGDAALRGLYEAPQHGLRVHDLGQAWRDWTGLPMVFAVWAARREFVEQHPGQVKEVHESFLVGRDRALANIDEVAARAARFEVFDAATLAGYFRTLDFSLGERQLAGLREFARRSAPLTGLDPEPEITVLDG